MVGLKKCISAGNFFVYEILKNQELRIGQVYMSMKWNLPKYQSDVTRLVWLSYPEAADNINERVSTSLLMSSTVWKESTVWKGFSHRKVNTMVEDPPDINVESHHINHLNTVDTVETSTRKILRERCVATSKALKWTMSKSSTRTVDEPNRLEILLGTQEFEASHGDWCSYSTEKTTSELEKHECWSATTSWWHGRRISRDEEDLGSSGSI